MIEGAIRHVPAECRILFPLRLSVFAAHTRPEAARAPAILQRLLLLNVPTSRHLADRVLDHTSIVVQAILDSVALLFIDLSHGEKFALLHRLIDFFKQLLNRFMSSWTLWLLLSPCKQDNPHYFILEHVHQHRVLVNSVMLLLSSALLLCNLNCLVLVHLGFSDYARCRLFFLYQLFHSHMVLFLLVRYVLLLWITIFVCLIAHLLLFVRSS